MSMNSKSMDLEQVVGNVLQTTSNVGGDIGLALAIVGQDAPFRGLTAGSNVTLNVIGDSSIEIGLTGVAFSPLTTKGDIWGYDTGDARIPVGTDGQILKANSAIGLGVEWVDDDSQATVSNLGTGEGVFAQQVANDFQFKSLVAGIGMTISSSATEILFESLAAQNTEVPVRNNSGVDIDRGECLYVVDAGGVSRISVAKAQSDANATMPCIGVARDDIPNNTDGILLAIGILLNVDTSAFSTGDLLYVSSTTAGSYETSPPAHPNLNQFVAVVLIDNVANGVLGVRPGDMGGDEQGTNQNEFLVGDAEAGLKTLGFVDDVGQQSIEVDSTTFKVDLLIGSTLDLDIDGNQLISIDETDITVNNLNVIMNGGYTQLEELVTEPTAPAANNAILWLDPSVIINDHPRLALTDENDITFDLSSAGMVVNTYNTEAIGSDHYLALSGLNSSNGTFINRAVVLPRSTRFYNMYVVVTTNATSVVVNLALNDAAASPTVLDIDIPIGTTGTFFNVDDFVDLEVGTEVAYRFGPTTGGTLAVASVGMATDILRLID